MGTAERQYTIISERVVDRMLELISRYKIPLLTSVIMGLMAHMFAFTNKLINHDEVTCLLSKGMSLSSGRWGLDVFSCIYPDFSMPWLYGVISILLIAAACCFMISLFSIRRKLFQVLLAAVVVTFPSLTGIFTYMFTATSYATAFLLSVVAAWLLKRKDRRSIVCAVICMVLSISTYQAYIAVTAGLLVVSMIKRVCSTNPFCRSLKMVSSM